MAMAFQVERIARGLQVHHAADHQRRDPADDPGDGQIPSGVSAGRLRGSVQPGDAQADGHWAEDRHAGSQQAEHADAERCGRQVVPIGTSLNNGSRPFHGKRNATSRAGVGVDRQFGIAAGTDNHLSSVRQTTNPWGLAAGGGVGVHRGGKLAIIGDRCRPDGHAGIGIHRRDDEDRATRGARPLSAAKTIPGFEYGSTTLAAKSKANRRPVSSPRVLRRRDGHRPHVRAGHTEMPPAVRTGDNPPDQLLFEADRLATSGTVEHGRHRGNDSRLRACWYSAGDETSVLDMAQLCSSGAPALRL